MGIRLTPNKPGPSQERTQGSAVPTEVVVLRKQIGQRQRLDMCLRRGCHSDHQRGELGSLELRCRETPELAELQLALQEAKARLRAQRAAAWTQWCENS